MYLAFIACLVIGIFVTLASHWRGNDSGVERISDDSSQFVALTDAPLRFSMFIIIVIGIPPAIH